MLNSSAACYWLKQVAFCKGAGGAGGGLEAEEWFRSWAFNATKVADLPVPSQQPAQLPPALVQTSTALQAQSPAATLASWSGPESGELRTQLAAARDQTTRLRRQLIAWQEELDWQIYEAFGLVLGALVAFSPVTQAQEKKRGGPTAEEQLKQLTELLTLTAEQKAKLEPILKEQSEKMRAILADQNAPKEDSRKKMGEMRTEFTGKIKAALTKEQGEKYDKFLAEAAAKRKKQ